MHNTDPLSPLRYVPLTPNEWTYHPETDRAACLLRWLTGGELVTTAEALAVYRASWGW